MIEIEGPDGVIYEFPEGTSEDVMRSALAQVYGNNEPAPERGLGATLYENLIGSGEADTIGEKIGAGIGDVARSFGAGVSRGVTGLIDLPGQVATGGINLTLSGLEAAGLPSRHVEGLRGAFSEGMPLINGPSFREGAAQLSGGATEYQGQTTAGEYAGTMGEFIPGLLTPGSTAARVGYGVVAPALASEGAGQLTEAMGGGETAQGLARLAGAIAGPAAAERGLRGIISPTAGTAAPRVEAAERLREAGVPVTAGQQSGSGLLRRLEGTDAPSEQQLEALTQSALRSIGSEGTRATDDVLSAARDRIGGVFNDVTQNLTPVVDPSQVARLRSAADTYRQLAPTANRAPIIDNIVSAISRPNANISADQIMTWRSRLSNLTTSSDAATRQAAIDALEAVDDIVQGSLQAAGRADDVGALTTARRQWRDYLAIERAASQGGQTAAEGLLTPGGLRMGVQGQNRGQYVRGERGDLGDITRAAQGVLTSAPSVLPSGVREATGRVMTTGAGALLGGGAGMALGLAAPELTQALITSRPAQTYLRNQLMGPAVSRLTPAQRAILYGPSATMQDELNQRGPR